MPTEREGRSHGAVALAGHLRDFERDFSGGREIRLFLENAGCQIIRADFLPPPGRNRPWRLHIRLPAQLEAEFGFSRELLLVATHWPEFQVRSLEVLREENRRAPRVEPETTCVFVRDPMASDKAYEWCGNDFTVVTVTPTDVAAPDPAEQLRKLLRSCFYGRNFYAEAGPVTGERFFGRANSLRQVDSDLNSHRPIGVFGLRKIGKTSLLKQFLARLSPPRYGIYIDLLAERIHGDARHLVVSMVQRLRELEVIAPELFPIPRSWRDDPSAAVSDLFDRLSAALQEELSNLQLVFAFDEIEALYPTASSPGLEHWDSMLAGLRALWQTYTNFHLIFAGVNASVLEVASVQERDNPVFSFTQPTYLGCMSEREMERMVLHLGKRTGIAWPAESLKALRDATGGHPYLTRLVCSHVVAGLIPPTEIELEHLRERLSTYLDTQGSSFVEILDSIRRHFPEELEILERLAAEGHLPTRAVPPSMLPHLLGYDLVERSDGLLRIRIGLLLDWMRR